MRPLAPPHQSHPTVFYYPGSNQGYVRSSVNPGTFVKYGPSPHSTNVVSHSVPPPHTVSNPNMGGGQGISGIRQSSISKSIYSGPGGLPHPTTMTMTGGIHGGGGAASNTSSTVSQYTSGQGTLTPQLRGGIFTIWLAKFVGDIVALFGG